MKNGIPAIQKQIRSILDRHGAKRAAIFGSVARGEAMPDSDVDILVALPEGATLLDLVSLKQELEAALQREVDVLTYNGLHPLLKDRIQQEAIAL